MAALEHRSTDRELMDDLNCSGDVVDQTLRELEFINKWLGGNAVTAGALKRLLRYSDKKHLSICDLGCGGGDMLKLIYSFGKKTGHTFSLTGIDANPAIVDYALKNLSGIPRATARLANVLDEACTFHDYDVVIGTLFFHHFSDEELVELFKRIYGQVSVGFIINDIHRHYLAYHSIKILTNWFSHSPMVKNDAALSVQRAFRKAELERILMEAGIKKYEIRWRWAFRWQVIVYK